MTSLRSPLWRCLQDVPCSHPPCYLALTLAVGARLADFECMCQAVGVFEAFICRTGNSVQLESPVALDVLARDWQKTAI